MNWKNKYFGFIIIEILLSIAALISSTDEGFLYYFILFNFVSWGLIALQKTFEMN